MYTYRIVLDAYNSRSDDKSARVVTYSWGHDRDDALLRLGSIRISGKGVVSDGMKPWPGTLNMGPGHHPGRSLPEYTVVSMRSVKKAGVAKVISE